ncbi:MAG: ATP-binding cassette domain-containing protein [Proteobacteria bacterium]|nr:ATP-binding cassette domain-containing protein [Pseudomonadota bacterium]
MLEAFELMVFYENMIALNNVSIKCDEGSIIGIFGSNSAGKSTLMYALSGIILDIKKKEEMRGGERISVYGRIFLDGKDVTTLKPHQRAKVGIVLCPERRRISAESSVLEKSRICPEPLSPVERPPASAGRLFERWRTTDACYRKGAYG